MLLDRKMLKIAAMLDRKVLKIAARLQYTKFLHSFKVTVHQMFIDV